MAQATHLFYKENGLLILPSWWKLRSLFHHLKSHPLQSHGLFLKPRNTFTMKTMKCIKANKLCYFVCRTRCPLRNFKFFMNFMVEAAEVELQEKTMTAIPQCCISLLRRRR